MDSLTQAALGAAIGQAILGKEGDWKPLAAGALIATIPDLDEILYLFYDGFEMLRIHRGFSHSILFCLIGAFPLAFAISKMKWAQKFNYLRMWNFTFLCLITHVILDTFTSYGTQLLLPFSDARLGLDSINVVDPVYTLPLLLGSLLGLIIPSLKNHHFRLNTIGLTVSTGYLLLTLVVKQEIGSRVEADLISNNIDSQKVLTMPVGTANLNWYGVVKTSDGMYMKHYNLFSENDQELVYFPSNDEYLVGLNSEWVATMKWFSKGFYTVEKTPESVRFYNMQVDMRGMVLDRNPIAPTKGYFEIIQHADGSFDYASGTLP